MVSLSLSSIYEFTDILETFGGHIIKIPDVNVRLNQLVMFEIQSTDVLGENIMTGGDIWQYVLLNGPCRVFTLRALGTGPEKISHILTTDQRDGSYKVELKFTTRGQYNVQVVLRSEVEAVGSPLKFNVI
jgi:hypothetical protein